MSAYLLGDAPPSIVIFGGGIAFALGYLTSEWARFVKRHPTIQRDHTWLRRLICWQARRSRPHSPTPRLQVDDAMLREGWVSLFKGDELLGVIKVIKVAEEVTGC